MTLVNWFRPYHKTPYLCTVTSCTTVHLVDTRQQNKRKGVPGGDRYRSEAPLPTREFGDISDGAPRKQDTTCTTKGDRVDEYITSNYISTTDSPWLTRVNEWCNAIQDVDSKRTTKSIKLVHWPSSPPGIGYDGQQISGLVGRITDGTTTVHTVPEDVLAYARVKLEALSHHDNFPSWWRYDKILNDPLAIETIYIAGQEGRIVFDFYQGTLWRTDDGLHRVETRVYLARKDYTFITANDVTPRCLLSDKPENKFVHTWISNEGRGFVKKIEPKDKLRAEAREIKKEFPGTIIADKAEAFLLSDNEEHACHKVDAENNILVTELKEEPDHKEPVPDCKSAIKNDQRADLDLVLELLGDWPLCLINECTHEEDNEREKCLKTLPEPDFAKKTFRPTQGPKKAKTYKFIISGSKTENKVEYDLTQEPAAEIKNHADITAARTLSELRKRMPYSCLCCEQLHCLIKRCRCCDNIDLTKVPERTKAEDDKDDGF